VPVRAKIPSLPPQARILVRIEVGREAVVKFLRGILDKPSGSAQAQDLGLIHRAIGRKALKSIADVGLAWRR
jgi:hypothetical protein